MGFPPGDATVSSEPAVPDVADVAGTVQDVLSAAAAVEAPPSMAQTWPGGGRDGRAFTSGARERS